MGHHVQWNSYFFFSLKEDEDRRENKSEEEIFFFYFLKLVMDGTRAILLMVLYDLEIEKRVGAHFLVAWKWQASTGLRHIYDLQVKCYDVRTSLSWEKLVNDTRGMITSFEIFIRAMSE